MLAYIKTIFVDPVLSYPKHFSSKQPNAALHEVHQNDLLTVYLYVHYKRIIIKKNMENKNKSQIAMD